MSLIRCSTKGCERDLWYRDHTRTELLDGNATCMGCHQTILCLDHFQQFWARNKGRCHHCKSQQWSVKILPNTRFSPRLQKEILSAGGQFSMDDTAGSRSNNTPTPYPRGRHLGPMERARAAHMAEQRAETQQSMQRREGTPVPRRSSRRAMNAYQESRATQQQTHRPPIHPRLRSSEERYHQI